ncbi:MAG: AsnC family transcriptional regulator [Gammaproteobacteria bacterium]|nr:AsnC family transcriptional regulator [Gammaproteobacteria bacterium]
MPTAVAHNEASRTRSPSVRSRRSNGGPARTAEGARSGVSGRACPVPPGLPPGIRTGGVVPVASEAPVLDWLDRRLLDACRRDFPICERPFAEIARRLGDRAGEVLRRFEALERRGAVNWLGPVLAPESIGVSTMVAMAVPEARLRSIREAAIRYPGVDQIFEREHEFNLWFALAAPSAGELYDTVADIRRRTGVEVLDLRMERDYCGDAGFRSLRRTASELHGATTETSLPERRPPLDASDRRLLAAIQEGLPLTARPYAAVAKRAGISETQAVGRLKRLLGEGLITRMGVFVRHDPPGLGANALVVFEVSRHAVDMVGERLADAAWIDGCHQRIPRAPTWPYNLYCTLQDRDLARLICWVDEEFSGTVRCPRRAVLFCRACHSAGEMN